MEFLRRNQQAAIAYARKTLGEMLDAADAADDAKLTTTKNEARELLRQGKALEDTLPDREDSPDPVEALRLQYRAAMYRVRRAAQDLVEASDAKDDARLAAAKEAARALLRPRGVRKTQ